MSDILLAYKASQDSGGIYDMIWQTMERDNQANKEVADEYADFKEFLIDHYMNGMDEFKDCYLQFMRWQGYTDNEIKKLYPQLLES